MKSVCTKPTTPITAADIHVDSHGTVRSVPYGDIYFAPNNGVAESTFVFLQGCHIKNRIAHSTDTHTVLELGFGTGLNFLLTLQTAAQQNKGRHLHFISIEKHPIHPDALRHIYTFLPTDLHPYADAMIRAYPPLTYGVHTVYVCGAKLTLYFADVKQAIPQITAPIDSLYLDGFAPRKNADMWHKDIFTHLYTVCRASVQIGTFSASSSVQKALKTAGFFVHKRKGFGRKRHCLSARKTLWTPPKLCQSAPICIVGAGVMGTALAHHLANAGYKIRLYDTHPRPLMATSGSPYALLMPKFNKTVPFHQNAYVYACAYFDRLQCLQGGGIIAYTDAVPDPTAYIKTVATHTKGTENMLFDTSGAVRTTAYADVVLQHKNITYIHRTLPHIPNTDFQMVILCLGADTNALLPRPVPYTLNRGSVAVLKNPPPQMPTIPTYHKGYTYSDGTIGICGAHFERLGDWRADVPALNTRTHTKHIADKMRFFNIDIYTTPHTLHTGIRANTKNRTPVIHQPCHNTFCIYGMGARGYINAPYTAHLFCQYVLHHRHHADLERMFENT